MRDALELIERRDRSAQTKQTSKLEKVLDELERPLRKVALGYHGMHDVSDARKDGIAKDIAAKAKAALAVMVLTFEDKDYGKQIKKKLRKWENFKKMLRKFADASDWDEMQDVTKSLQTKSKWAWDKYWEYKEFALMALRAIDVEHEGVLTAGPFEVRLLSSAGVHWDRDTTDKVKAVISKVVKDISSVGLRSAIGGKIQAYPTSTVPASGKGSSSTLAIYNNRLDLFRIAVGGDSSRVAKTMTHEFGHRVYYRMMGNRGRRAWEEFFGAKTGKPDLRQIMKLWEDFASRNQYGAWLGHFHGHLKKVAPDQVMWLELSAEALEIQEKFHRMTGAPTKGKKNVPALKVFKEKMNQIKVFLHPVTTYSGTNPAELFAETFAFIIQKGPQRIPPVTRAAFTRALPQIKGGSRMMEATLLRIEQA